MVKHGKFWRHATTGGDILQLIDQEHTALESSQNCSTGGHQNAKSSEAEVLPAIILCRCQAMVLDVQDTHCTKDSHASPESPTGYNADRGCRHGPLPDSPARNLYTCCHGLFYNTYAIPNQEAITIAKKFVTEIFLRFAPPEQLQSEQGRQFEAQLMKEVSKCLAIKKTTTPYHSQCDPTNNNCVRMRIHAIYTHPPPVLLRRRSAKAWSPSSLTPQRQRTCSQASAFFQPARNWLNGSDDEYRTLAGTRGPSSDTA